MSGRSRRLIVEILGCKAALVLGAAPASAAINCSYSITDVNFGGIDHGAQSAPPQHERGGCCRVAVGAGLMASTRR